MVQGGGPIEDSFPLGIREDLKRAELLVAKSNYRRRIRLILYFLLSRPPAGRECSHPAWTSPEPRSQLGGILLFLIALFR